MLQREGCEGRDGDESMRSEHVRGGMLVGAELEGWGGRTLHGGWRGKVPIETSRAIPTRGGASRADFAKVSPGQRGAGEMHPLGAGRALYRVLSYLERAHGARVTWGAPGWM